MTGHAFLALPERKVEGRLCPITPGTQLLLGLQEGAGTRVTGAVSGVFRHLMLVFKAFLSVPADHNSVLYNNINLNLPLH